MNWRVLDLTGFEGQLRYKRGHISIIGQDGSEHGVNLKEVGVVLVGGQASLSSGLLTKLSTEGIPLLITDWRAVPVGALQSWSNHTRVGARQIAQANLSLPRRKSAWAAIVKAKIEGQAVVQRHLGNEYVGKQLNAMAKQVRSGDPNNLEGQAARLHWRHFVGSTGFARHPDADDWINGSLNYGYTILRGFAIRAVLEAGLWPAVGVFHHGRSNAFNLSDDLIEPFRPVVDYVVTKLPTESSLEDPLVKKRLVGASSLVFAEDGTTVATAMGRVAQRYGRYVEGDLDRFKLTPWIGPRGVEGE